MPVATWREMMDAHYPNGAWVRLHATRSPRCAPARERGLPSYDACVAELLEDAEVNAALEELLGTLLFEGYALYPYTPGATKNATPTPFGIVYPPAYARRRRAPSTSCACRASRSAGGDAVLSGEVRFLQGAGERHQAVPRRLERRPHARRPGERADVEPSSSAPARRVRMSADDLGEGRWRVLLCVHNTTPVAEGLDRAGRAGAHAALHAPGPAARGRALRLAAGGAAGPESVNTFPVLATDDDDALLGAAIMLPDHPQLAPESRGDLFDGTEIEEALLLHVLALSDDEREAIARPTRRCARWSRAPPPPRPRTSSPCTGETLPRPERRRTAAAARRARRGRGRRSTASPTAAATRSCCARATRDPYDRILDGRTATIERIYFDYETSSTSASRSTTIPARS